MATRVGYVGTESPGDTLTAANFNKAPNGLVAYGVITSNSSGFTSVADVSGLTFTYTFPGGRLYRLSLDLLVQVSSAVSHVRMFLTDGSATQQTYWEGNLVTTGDNYAAYRSVLITPSAGSTTYKVRGQVTAGGGTGIVAASATLPAGIYLEDLGPTF